jgi:hypothetical protein
MDANLGVFGPTHVDVRPEQGRICKKPNFEYEMCEKRRAREVTKQRLKTSAEILEEGVTIAGVRCVQLDRSCKWHEHLFETEN